ncbi:MAG TPA: NAD-dependent epimerase/dehydratase family protein [Bryobacteraceae bacterium]|nr:NAD-dependent epimerase/dehydratase family protein [Bryobacteraceae bacterium]
MLAWVTGGAGFLGSHIADALLRRGWDVVAVDDLSTGEAAQVDRRVRLHRTRVQEAEELLANDRPEIVFHFAGDARIARSVVDPRVDCERNLGATLELLESIRKRSPQTRVLFASTGAVYGGSAARAFREDDPVFPLSPYAVSKLAAERYCYAYAETFGLRTCSLRLFSVYGPRQRKQVVYDLIRKLHDRPAELAILGDGTQERDFSHVDNIVDAFLLAAERAAFAGEAINAAGNEVIRISQLAEMLCQVMNVAPRIVYGGQLRAGDSQRWVADTERLRAMGYSPRVTLLEGLRNTVDWYRSHPEAALFEG